MEVTHVSFWQKIFINIACSVIKREKEKILINLKCTVYKYIRFIHKLNSVLYNFFRQIKIVPVNTEMVNLIM